MSIGTRIRIDTMFLLAFCYTASLLPGLPMGTSLQEKTLRIHGGWGTAEDRYSYAQISLIYKDEGHQCGGSLVALDVILTASHCQGSFDKILIGKHRSNDETDLYEVFEPTAELINPMYDEVATRFDTMLVFLNGTSKMARPVRVNDNDRLPSHGTMLTVIGWGYNADWDLPDVLQEADVRYSRNSQCDDLVDSQGKTLDGQLYGDMMCAGSTGRDSCYGDSGSPLILRGIAANEDIQIGLVSWGYECAGHLPGVYSRLSYYHNFQFIEQHVCLYSAQPPSYFQCGRWTSPPTKEPTIEPTQRPTMSPIPLTTVPTIKPTSETIARPSDSLSKLYNSPSNEFEMLDPARHSLAPTTLQLKEFLEGASSIPLSKTSTIITEEKETLIENEMNSVESSSGTSVISLTNTFSSTFILAFFLYVQTL